jgi:predicted ATPase
MITRFYVNNFRCLVAFEMRAASFSVICGANGAGKSSVIDALLLVQNLASGNSSLGGEGSDDIRDLEFTRWLNLPTQEFELAITTAGRCFDYSLKLEQTARSERPRIVHERALCDGSELFTRDPDGVRFTRRNGTQAQFPLSWWQAALGNIQPDGPLRDIQLLQDAIASIFILRTNPMNMEKESCAETRKPNLQLSNLISWYRSLSQEQAWTDSLRDSLQIVWHDFRSFRLVDTGMNRKSLQLRFEGVDIHFHELSDGERALLALYMIRAALDTNSGCTVLLDEPDNFVGLSELQPWVLSLRELLDENHQALLSSHHPEILSQAGEESGILLWRDSHLTPTRIGALNVPAGLTAGEAMARGWIHG